MTFPCCGCVLKIGCRICGCLDIILSILSIFQWMNLFMESTFLRGEDWDRFVERSLHPKRSFIELRCGTDYFDLNVPNDIGNQIVKVALFYSLAAFGYLINGLFLLYATVSAPDAGRVLLRTFGFCNLFLMALSLVGATIFQDPVLCFYQFDGTPGHRDRQLVFLALTLVFVFGYKIYELILVLFYMVALGRVTPAEVDFGVSKMSPAEARAVQLVTPKPSKQEFNNQPDVNMNYDAPTDIPGSIRRETMDVEPGLSVVIDYQIDHTTTGLNKGATTDDNDNGTYQDGVIDVNRNSIELGVDTGPSYVAYSPNICGGEY